MYVFGDKWNVILSLLKNVNLLGRTKTKYHFGFSYPTSTRRHGNFAGVHTLLRILLSSNSAVLINIITGVSPPHFDFVVYLVIINKNINNYYFKITITTSFFIVFIVGKIEIETVLKRTLFILMHVSLS
jgi:hypothetical protein